VAVECGLRPILLLLRIDVQHGRRHLAPVGSLVFGIKVPEAAVLRERRIGWRQICDTGSEGGRRIGVLAVSVRGWAIGERFCRCVTDAGSLRLATAPRGSLTAF
jgi:hypothetical protein